jgi:hypothetical protein
VTKAGEALGSEWSKNIRVNGLKEREHLKEQKIEMLDTHLLTATAWHNW